MNVNLMTHCERCKVQSHDFTSDGYTTMIAVVRFSTEQWKYALLFICFFLNEPIIMEKFGANTICHGLYFTAGVPRLMLIHHTSLPLLLPYYCDWGAIC